MKRLWVPSLLCALLCTLLVLPASASSSFSDIQEEETALAADALRLLGVVSGSGENRFSPENSLTRAEFCVMAVRVLGLGEEVPGYMTRTIFTDVTAQHWGRGYINLAASTPLGSDEQAGRLISGVGNGKFLPDAEITYAQAATILVRMLGYGDEAVGALWPQGYLNEARALGLTEGLEELQPAQPLTRAQAAQLFFRLLSARTAAGAVFYERLGTGVEDVILLDSGVTVQGVSEGLSTSQGSYLPRTRGVDPMALLGKRGTLLLGGKQELLGFLPRETDARQVVLSAGAQADGFRTQGGERWSIPAEAKVYTRGEEETSTYGKIWMDLRAGDALTLFRDQGKVTGLYRSVGERQTAKALIASGQLTQASLLSLTEDPGTRPIVKSGRVISLSDIQPYDVVSYDASREQFQVSDLRVLCVYESASPNPQTPQRLHALGYDFQVLESAWDSLSRVKPGDLLLLLLTAQGEVAGVEKPSASLRKNAPGYAGASSVQLFLPAGGSLELTGSGIQSSQQSRLVQVSSVAAGELSLSLLSSSRAPGELDTKSLQLGSLPVSPQVRIYDAVQGSPAAELSMETLERDKIPREQISAYHADSSGTVDLILLENCTGDAYRYGRLSQQDVRDGTDGDVAYHTVSVENRSGSTEWIWNRTVPSSPLGGAAVGSREVESLSVAVAVIELREAGTVNRSDFFQREGRWYVTCGGRVYPVAEQVEGYYARYRWFTQDEDRLEAIRAYSDQLKLYVDPIGEKVRVIAVETQ